MTTSYTVAIFISWYRFLFSSCSSSHKSQQMIRYDAIRFHLPSLISIAFILSTLVIFPQQLKAQNDEIQFEHLSANDGITNGFMILYLHQDEREFMWFYNDKYDGKEFQHYKKSNADGIPSLIKMGQLLRENWGKEPDSLYYFDAARDSFIFNLPKRLLSVYHEQNHPFISISCNGCFLQDTKEDIWLGSATTGIFIYNPKTKNFKNIRHDGESRTSLSSDSTSTLLRDDKDRIWVGTRNAGLNLWDKKGSFTVFRTNIDDNNSLSSNNIIVLTEDEQGIIWIGTTKGLSRLDPTTQQITRIPLDVPSRPVIRKIFIDSSGKLWIVTRSAQSVTRDPENETVVLYDPTQQKVIAHFEDLWVYWNNTIFSIVEDHLGRIWLGTDKNGIYIYDHRTREMTNLRYDPKKPKSLANDRVRQMIKDKHNRIWIGTFNGVNYYDPNAKVFKHLESDLSKERYFKSEEKPSGVEDHLGNIWIATRGAGIIKLVPSTGDTKVYKKDKENKYNMPGNDILRLVADDKGLIWFTSWYGIYVLNPITERVITLQNQDTYAALMKDSAGHIWVGRYRGLLRYTDPMTSPTIYNWEMFEGKLKTLPNKFYKNSDCWSLAEDCQGNIWISGNYPLMRFNPRDSSIQQFGFIPDNPTQTPQSWWLRISRDQHCNLWFASNGAGLSRLTPTEQVATIPSFQHWNSDNSDLTSNNIGMVVGGKKNDVWFGNRKGITQLDLGTNRFQTYGLKEGMKTSTPEGAVVFSKEGILYFGGMNGIGYFAPYSLATNEHSPAVYIKDIEVNGHSLIHTDSLPFKSPLKASLSFTNTIQLKHWQNNIQLEFVALNYTAPENNKYKYQLVGYDEGWKETTANHPIANYPKLDYGKYTFLVKGANNDGKENDTPVTLVIKVSSPWYWSTGSKCLYGLLIIGFIYTLYHFQLKRRLANAEAFRLQELDQVKTRLYTNITHEFRTPLTVISGMAGQVLANPQQWFREGLTMIQRNSQHLLDLVNQLLDLTKLEAGRLSIDLVHDDIIPFLRYFIESFQSYAETKAIRLHVLAETEKLSMNFDPIKLQSILSNLFNNAIKFTPSGGDIYIKINKDLSSNGQALCQIRVTDTGIGISSTQLPHVFDRFYQADDSNTRSAEGTGIGLALTKELVELLGGEITVESKLGKGTSFNVRLPIQKDAIPMKAIPQVRPQVKISNDTHSAIVTTTDAIAPIALLIEDNTDVLRYLSTCLEGIYQLEMAVNGKDGIEKAIEIVPDIIISDVMMPEKDGFEVLQTLKQDERTSHIPIVLLTAKADAASRIQGLSAGADAYLAKPFDKNELEVRLKKLIELRQQLQRHYQSLPSPAENGNKLKSREDSFLQKIRELVESNIDDETFGILQICKALSISRSQLHRKLKALTGRSTSIVIRTIRLQKAKYLLATSNLNVSEIGYATGFLNNSYFTQVFSQEFGDPPSHFRENLLGDNKMPKED